ncbi:MAG: neutral/alkaline non-lysosomal ceramidase N-terminal domain-containing protein [Myxococcales bacterium]|nr:neutral/alkaline non-lysosomal ceramidase N-terminal domain-containing protein [Myxococcales bacterium]
MRRFALVLVAFSSCPPPPTPPADAGPLQAAVATTRIEVPVGAPTGGYSRSKPDDDPGSRWSTNFPSTKGVHTDATARTLALSNGLTRTAFVRLDVCLITPSLRTRIRTKLDAANEAASFIVQATHTHGHVARLFQPVRLGNSTGPDFAAFGMDTYDAELEDRVASAAVASVLEAFSALTPVSVGVASVDGAELNADRRCENDSMYGPEFRDRVMTVVRFDAVDETGTPTRPLTALLHYTVHGTVMAGSNPFLTTDVTGAIELAASDTLGVPVVFAQGAAGDVSPKGSPLGFEGTQQLEWSGRVGATLARTAFEQAKPGVAPKRGRLVHVDRGVLLSREALGYQRGEFPEHGGIGCQVGGRSCSNVVLTPPEQGGLLCASVEPRPRDRTPLTLLQVEDVAMVTLPGEPTTAMGVKVAAAMAPLGASTRLVLGYAQDHFGYLLEQNDFLRGGYEPTVSPWGWRMGQYLIDEAGKLVATKDAAQEKPTTATIAEPVLRVVEDSDAAPVVVADTMDLERARLVRFVFTGGEPGLGTPSVAVEREVNGAFVPVMVSPTRALVNGPEVLRRYEATPTVAAEPLVTKRRHEWTALWETLPDTTTGRYRLVATGRAQLDGVVQSYRFESRAFTLGASTAITSLAARALMDGRVLVTARYEPNPMRFDRGDPVANFRLRDVTTRPDLGMPARGGSMMLEAKLGVSGLMLPATWSEADQGYLLTIPTNTGGSWEITIARGALVDGLGNSNGVALTARFDR